MEPSICQASEEHLKQHYIDLKDRPFFPGLVKYMNSGPVVAMVSVCEGLTGLLCPLCGPDSPRGLPRVLGLYIVRS